MATQDDVIADSMNPDEPMVTFKFSDGSKDQVYKKVLVENSDVFKTILGDEKSKTQSQMVIEITGATFTGSDTMPSDFKCFIKALCGFETAYSFEQAMNVYVIAHKYQVEKVKVSAMKAMAAPGQSYPESKLDLIYDFLSKFNMSPFPNPDGNQNLEILNLRSSIRLNVRNTDVMNEPFFRALAALNKRGN